MKNQLLKECLLIDLISYATLSLILSLLGSFSDKVVGLNHFANLQLFVTTTIISIMIYFTASLKINSELAKDFIILAEISLVVFGVGGGIFGWFPWELEYVIEVTAVLLAVFLVTRGILIWQNSEDAKAINKKIKERKQ